MRQLKLFQWAAVLILATALAPGAASAQAADTLSISGTFMMHYQYGTVGNDLAAAYADDYAHGWSLTLHGVTQSTDAYSDWYYDEWGEYLHVEKITRVHATSFGFQFFGPDASILNAVVGQQLVGGGLSNGGYLELHNHYYYDSIDGSLVWGSGNWELSLVPLDASAGVSFTVVAWDQKLLTDQDGYPLVEAQRLTAWNSAIRDLRPGNSGSVESANDFVDLGSDVPPVLPLTLNIADGSALEGKKGTTQVNLTVTLSRVSNDVVTVKYATSNGTALAKSDYTAASGTVTFQPGQTKRTIPVSIKGDRTREADEAFTVRLSNAVRATIEDGSATVTIRNDD
jgi:hypothetical protein